jgi:glutathione S-transferase
MAHEIIFHHYWTSPFSEKVRLVFGIKDIAWKSVEIPNMMPKPDLLPLTGGYRKTPVMQIGADIYCDTQIIIRELERRFPTPPLFDRDAGLPFGLGFWCDRIFFMATVGVVFGEIGDSVPESFRKDRAAMSGGTFSTEALKANAPFAYDQFRAHTAFVADQLADGRAFVRGNAVSMDDLQAHMNFWFLKSAVPHILAKILAEFPAVTAWYDRVSAFRHGKHTEMAARDALAIAAAATSEAKAKADPNDPAGLKPGTAVAVSADDYGRDPIAGDVVFADRHEIAIRRTDKQVGEVVVHFPRAGFNVVRT